MPALRPRRRTEPEHVAACVLTAMVPELPHLRPGPALDELVRSASRAACDDARHDPDVRDLPEGERRRVIATRVGLTLAFPP